MPEKPPPLLLTNATSSVIKSSGKVPENTFLANNKSRKEFPIKTSIEREIRLWVNDPSVLRSNGDIALDISTAYFSPSGWYELKESLQDFRGRVRILLGTEQERYLAKRKLDIADIEESILLLATKNIEETRNSMAIGALYKMEAFLKWLKSHNNVEVRLYTQNFLHAKTWHFYDQAEDFKSDTDEDKNAGSMIVSSANFTYSGMRSNIEAGVFIDDRGPTLDGKNWFEDRWHESYDYKSELEEIYAELIENHEPELIYMKIIIESLKSKKIEDALAEIEDEPLNWLEGLAQFQADGAKQAQARLNIYNGAIIADEVGLGKTYMAGALIKKALSNNQNVLVVAPSSIQNTWVDYLNVNIKKRLHDKNLISLSSYVKVTTPRKLINEEFPLTNWGLIVFDEAHLLRNDMSKTYRALSTEFLPKVTGSKLLFLTATPINNKLNDIYSILKLFLPDSRMQNANVPSLKYFFERAEKAFRDKTIDPRSIEWGWLHAMLDHLMVKRTRSFISKHYDDIANDPDWKFPRLENPKYKRYSFIGEYKLLANEIINVMSLKDADYNLTLAAYNWGSYLRGNKASRYRGFTTGLVRTTLLKALESSPESLLVILNTLKNKTETVLDKLGSLDGADTASIHESEEDSSETTEEDIDTEISESEPLTPKVKSKDNSVNDPIIDSITLNDFNNNYEEFKYNLRGDLDLLKRWIKIITTLEDNGSTKMEKLIEILEEVNMVAKNNDEKKVIVFCTSRATVEKLGAYMNETIQLEAYKDRILTLHGGIPQNSRNDLLKGFAPKSMAIKGKGKDEYNLLLTTDVLSEGVNLQQASVVIHFDLPWNPMKLIQRVGRVNRLKSNHDAVHNYLITPEEDHFNATLNLLNALNRKMALASAVLGENDILDSSPRVTDTDYEEIDSLLQEAINNNENSATTIKNLKRKLNKLGLFSPAENIYYSYLNSNGMSEEYNRLLQGDDTSDNAIGTIEKTLNLNDLVDLRNDFLASPENKALLASTPYKSGSIAYDTTNTKNGWLICFKITEKDNSHNQSVISSCWVDMIDEENITYHVSWEAIQKANSYDNKSKFILRKAEDQTVTDEFNAELTSIINLAQDKISSESDYNPPSNPLDDIQSEVEDFLESASAKEKPESLNEIKQILDFLSNGHLLTEGTIKSIKSAWDGGGVTRIHALNNLTRQLVARKISRIVLKDPQYEVLAWMRIIPEDINNQIIMPTDIS